MDYVTSTPAEKLDRLAYLSLWAFVFAVPWEEAVPLLGGFVVSRWFALLALGFTIAKIALNRKRRKLSPLHFGMMALVAWVALSLLWTADWDSTANRTMTYVQLLVACWLIWETAVTENRVLGLLFSYVMGTYVCAGDTLANFALGRTAAEMAAARGHGAWEEGRYTVGGLNENDLGLILALSIPISLYILSRDKRRFVKFLCWVHLVACCTAILLSGSRGATLSAMVGLLMFPMTVGRLPRWQKIVALFACAGTAAFAIYLVPPAIWERLLLFKEEVSQGTMTHRTVIWAAGLQAFRMHPVLGVGAGAYGPTVFRMIDIPYVAHNTFLSVLVELGVVGELLLLSLIAGSIYCAFRMNKLDRYFWIILFLTWAVGVSALTWEYRKPTWLLFGLIAAHAYSRRRGTLRARSVDRRAPVNDPMLVRSRAS